MATEPLVRSEIDAGLALVRILDSAGFHVVAALWLYSSDSMTWRFVIASTGDAKAISGKYLEAARAVSVWREAHPDEPILALDRVKIVGVNDPLISGLKPIIRMEGLWEIRFSNNLVNGVFVEDALIHRLAA